jgi:hypothetical protein
MTKQNLIPCLALLTACACSRPAKKSSSVNTAKPMPHYESVNDAVEAECYKSAPPMYLYDNNGNLTPNGAWDEWWNGVHQRCAARVVRQWNAERAPKGTPK